MDFIIRGNISFETIIDGSTLKRLRDGLDIKPKEVWMNYFGQKTVIPMFSEYSQPRMSTGGTDSGDFTLESSGEEFAREDAKVQKRLIKAILLTIRDGHERNKDSNEYSWIETAVDMELRLEHISEEVAVEKNSRYTSDGIAHSLHDLRPGKFFTLYTFELASNEPVYHRRQRMAPRHNQIVRQ